MDFNLQQNKGQLVHRSSKLVRQMQNESSNNLLINNQFNIFLLTYIEQLQLKLYLFNKYIKSILYFLYNISRLYCWDQLSQNWLFRLAGPEKKHFIINCHYLKIIFTLTIIHKPEYEFGVQGHTLKKRRELEGILQERRAQEKQDTEYFSKKNHRKTPETFSIYFYRNNNFLLSMQSSNTRQSCCSLYLIENLCDGSNSTSEKKCKFYRTKWTELF